MHYVIWVDVLWYSALITLGTKTNSVFFFFFLFAIIAGSSRGGTMLGLTLTAVCTGLFVIVNVLLLAELQLDVPRFARRTVYMASLGYILAYWGGAEAMLRKRLTFLKELSLLTNPRFGADWTIRQTLRRLLDFYQADYCFLVLSGPQLNLEFYRVERNGSPGHGKPMKVDENADIPLMNRSDPVTAAYVERTSAWRNRPSYRAYNGSASKELDVEPAQNAAEMLNVRSFITAPLHYRNRIRGRILVGSSEPSGFNLEDAAFLQQAADQVLPLIESIRLVDRLASDAAEEERRRLARSVHDRVIQPYLGLQIGLKALQQELSPPDRDGSLATQSTGQRLIEQLLLMTRDGIQELRQYVDGLRGSPAEETMLAGSIRRFAEQFEAATGIRVEVLDSACGLTMSDRLSAEVFQMTAEALSNIHRHTKSRHAEVRLTMVDNNLELSVENDAGNEDAVPFKPVSIFERVEALGGRMEVLWPRGKTMVRVEVPL
jgi:signal transduction histidine kinase